jgi:hypothetical protein
MVMKYLDVNIAIPSIWSNFRTGFIIVVILSTLAEIITTLYKGIKYNK